MSAVFPKNSQNVCYTISLSEIAPVEFSMVPNLFLQLAKAQYVAYVLQHKFQSCLITQWLSHISTPFLCQPVLPQKGEVSLLSPNPPVCQVGLAIRTLS